MQTLNNNDLAFLAILGNGDMTARALRMYADRTYLFTELATPHLCVMWDAYVDLLQQARSTPGMKRTREVAAAFMADAVQRSEALTEPLRDKCDRILDRYIRGEFPGEEESRLLVSNLIGQEANRAVMAKVSTCAGLSELKRTIDRSVRQVELGERVSVLLSDGKLSATVMDKKDFDREAYRRNVQTNNLIGILLCLSAIAMIIIILILARVVK